jgi:hypothetical protein
MLNFTNESEHLLNIATNDKATDVIKESLLNARKIGQKQLEDFVKDQLVLNDEEQSPKIPLLKSITPLVSTFFNKMSNSNDLLPDLKDPFVSAIAIETGISSCLSISDMLTSLPALKAVTILCNVFMSALTVLDLDELMLFLIDIVHSL